MNWQVRKNWRIKYLLIIIFIISGYFFLLVDNHLSQLITKCYFKELFEIPCPGCGMGSSTKFLLNGEVLNSFIENPLGPFFNLCVFLFLLGAIHDLLNNKNVVFPLVKQKIKNQYQYLIIIVIVISWIYRIIKHFQ